MTQRPIYLDYNATTPIDPEVVEAMRPYLEEHFGNPSSSHAYGRLAREAVQQAREQVAELIGAAPDEIVFTSGGSEANNMVIKGVVARSPGQRCRLVTSAVEHPAVLEPCLALEELGHQVEILPVDRYGWLDPQRLTSVSERGTVLVTLMHANNEVGTIQSVGEVAEWAHARGISVHTDAAQSIGKLAVSVDELGVDFLSLAGHKFYAPKGVGALYIRRGQKLPPLIHGAAHEDGRRAGTENVLLVVGLGKAAELARQRLERTATHSAAMRDRLWSRLKERLDDLAWNGKREACLPNTLSVAIKGTMASKLIERIGSEVAASAGSACHAEGAAVSTVLWAMGFSVERAVSTLRLSVGRSTTPREIDRAAEVISREVRAARAGG